MRQAGDGFGYQQKALVQTDRSEDSVLSPPPKYDAERVGKTSQNLQETASNDTILETKQVLLVR